MGPLISQEHRKKVLSFTTRQRPKARRFCLGGGVPKLDATFQKGAFIQPTIWTGLKETLRRCARGNLRPMLSHCTV